MIISEVEESSSCLMEILLSLAPSGTITLGRLPWDRDRKGLKGKSLQVTVF